MSKKVVKFPTKVQKAEPVEDSAKAIKYTIYNPPVGKDPQWDTAMKLIKEYDFRGAFKSYPDVGIPDVYTKQEILKKTVDIKQLVTAAIVAKHVAKNEEDSTRFMGLFKNYFEDGIISITVKCLPEDLIGYVIFFGEQTATTAELGQHPLSRIFLQYGWHSNCWRSIMEMRPDLFPPRKK